MSEISPVEQSLRIGVSDRIEVSPLAVLTRHPGKCKKQSDTTFERIRGLTTTEDILSRSGCGPSSVPPAHILSVPGWIDICIIVRLPIKYVLIVRDRIPPQIDKHTCNNQYEDQPSHLLLEQKTLPVHQNVFHCALSAFCGRGKTRHTIIRSVKYIRFTWFVTSFR